MLVCYIDIFRHRLSMEINLNVFKLAIWTNFYV